MEKSETFCGLCSKSRATVMCVCRAPGLSLCSACTLTHLASVGTHVIRTGPEAPLTNEVCSTCKRVEALTICCCKSEGTMLCAACLSGHLEKGTGHQQVPMQAKAYFRSPNYFDKLRAREKTISDGLKELEANLLIITDCEQILQSKTEAAIQEIIKYRENVLAELKVSREEAEHALVEARKQVAEHIYQDPYEPATQLTKSLWNFQSGNLKLFSYTLEGKYQVNISKSQPKLQQVLIQPPQSWADEYEEEEEEEEEEEKIVSEESNESIPSPILYIIKPKTISCYNVVAGLYSRDIDLSRTIKVNQTTAYCFLDIGTLWVCGGSSPYTNFVYEIDPSSGEVSNRSSMLMSRGGHAVL